MPAKSDMKGKLGAARRALGVVLACLLAAACDGESGEQALVKATPDERTTDSVGEGPTNGAAVQPRGEESAEEQSPVVSAEDPVVSVEDDLAGIEAQPEAAGAFRSLQWTPEGETIVTTGRRLSLWRGSPPERVRSARFRPRRFPTVSQSGIAVGCSEDVVCVVDADRLEIQQRLHCPEEHVGPTTVWGPKWSPDGLWVAAHCASGTSRNADSELVHTCVWSARAGRRVRCLDTRQLAYYTQPFGWRNDQPGLAVSILGGLSFLVPPAFDQSPVTEEAVHVQVAHPGDSRWRFDWSPTDPLIVGVTGDDGRIVQLGDTLSERRFEISGPVSDVAVAPDGQEVAILYRETLDIHDLPSGRLLRRLALDIQDGRLRWSPDSQLLAVEWQLPRSAGVTVYDRSTLRRLFGRRERGDRIWVPASWHPVRSELAYRNGRTVSVDSAFDRSTSP